MERKLYGKGAASFLFFYRPFIFLCSFFRKKEIRSIGKEPKILICCWASLGDVLLASSVIPDLKREFPNSTIGFLCAPTSTPILEVVKGIDHVHEVPCFKRIKIGKVHSLFRLFYHSLFVYPKALKKMKEIQYDVSLEMHPFFPGSVPLARRALIPNRIGFKSCGYDCILTDPILLKGKMEYLPFLYKELLRPLGVEKREEQEYCFTESNTIIFHLGTSDSRKEWEACQWHNLALFFKEKGYSLIFTGSGKRDRELIEEANLEKLGESLVDKLSFLDLSSYLKKAKLLVSVDSVPIHLASYLKIPFVALYLYSEGVDLWLPSEKKSRLLVQKNCTFMNKKPPERAICLEKITWADVSSHVTSLLSEL